MLLLELCFQALLLVNVSLKLPDCLCEALLVFMLSFSVVLKLLGSCRDLPLKLFTLILTFSDEPLILRQILLQVVKDLEFLIESNQSVQLMFCLNIFFFTQ